MNLYEEKRKIRDELGEAELLAGLAEEAAELIHAALKLRRALDGTNPTPVTPEQAREALSEEVADVLLYLVVLDQIADVSYYFEAPIRQTAEKLQRWLDRLKGGKSMSSSVLKIRRLASGKYVANVGKKAKVFDTLPEAVAWAEGKIEEPTTLGSSTEEFEKFWHNE